MRKGEGGREGGLSPRDFLLPLLLGALLLRLFYLRNTGAESSQDSYWLAGLAKDLLVGQFEITHRFASGVQPLYPLLMGLLSLLLGDLLFAGKVLALLGGMAAVPLTYLLWREIESEEAALFTAALLAVNFWAWYYSLHVFRDTLFLSFSLLALLLFYRRDRDPRALPLLGLTLGLGTLTRGEGYFLALALLLSLLFYRLHSGKEALWKGGWKAALLGLLLFSLTTLAWQGYVYTASGEVLPSRTIEETAAKGHAGLGWITRLADLTTLPFLLLALVGLWASREKLRDHLPLLLFLLTLSLPHMWFHEANPRYALPLLPILLGWATLGLFRYLPSLPGGGKRTVPAALSALLVLSLFHSAFAMAEIERKGDAYAVVRDAMAWFNDHAEPGSTLLVGDEKTYGYYTDYPLLDFPRIDPYLLALQRRGVKRPLESTLITEGIRYVVVYDSLTPWLYPATAKLGEVFAVHRYRIPYQIVVPSTPLRELEHGEKVRFAISRPVEREIAFVPLRKFEANGELVVLYQVQF
jgi:4-amino-4-deoxy-L-arabinose transferase-like glycosyltransferase